jgi:RecA-family ATPase
MSSISILNKNGRSPFQVTIDFLQELRPPPWILTAIVPDGHTTTVTAHTVDAVVAFCGEHNGKNNLYYTLNVTRTAMSKKPKKADIVAVEYLHADLDPADGESPDDAKARYLGQLNGSFHPPPTWVVDSGGGIQAGWRLAEPIGLENEDREALIPTIEGRSKEIMFRLGSEAGTQNIDRILRLPGTINVPNKKKMEKGRVACPTCLIKFNGASYGLDVFPIPAPEEHTKPGTPEDGGHHARQEPDGLEDKLERIIRLGENGEFNGDRSSAVFYVACEMLRRGSPGPAIVSTLLDPANKISDHVRAQDRPRAYAERQVARARERVPAPEVVVLPPSRWMGERRAVEPPALIKGVFPQTGVAMIGGQSGGGKTFHAINIGVHLIPDCKQNFYIDKYRIKRHGGVLYLVLEGKPAFPLRVTTAFEQLLKRQLEFGDRAKLPYAWNVFEPNLFNQGPDALIKLAEREAQKMRTEFSVDLVAVFLDTMGLAACYENEDKAAQVQRVISGLNRLSNETGALVIGVDHYGKDQGQGLRGSSAKRGHVETVLACLVDRDKDEKPTNHRLMFEKIRDGEEGRVIPYRLKQVDLGRDEDGDPLSTCVIQWEFDRRQQPKRKQQQKKKTDVALELAIKDVGLPADVEKLRAAFYKHHGGEKHTANVAWNRAINAMGLEVSGDKLV